jgi:hypothetical protein
MCSVSYVYLLFANNEAVECPHAGDGCGPEARLAGARPQRRPGVASKLKAAIGVVEESVLPVEELVTEVCHCHHKECCRYPPRESHILTGPAR